MTQRFLITLVRHGETMENRESIIQGQADTALSDLGRKQASLVGNRLQHERFTHMFASDLCRAADTARAIVDTNKVSTCKLVLDERLRERSFGIMQGKKFSELQNMIKEKNIPFKTYTPEEGETIEQVIKRASNFFKDICNIVAKSHTKSTDQSHQRSPRPYQHRGTNDGDNGCQEKPNTSTTTTSTTTATTTNTTTTTTRTHRNSQTTMEPLSLSIDSNFDASSNLSSSNGASSSSSSTSSYPDKMASLGASNESSVISILIVSHGLLLKELKRIILDRYRGSLPDDVAFRANRVSPNTGVSKFAMVASKEDEKKLSVRCVECCYLDCKSHLRSLESRDAKY